MKKLCKVLLAIVAIAAAVFALASYADSSDYVSVYDTDDDTPF